jgi:hypothetical protein
VVVVVVREKGNEVRGKALGVHLDRPAVIPLFVCTCFVLDELGHFFMLYSESTKKMKGLR